MPNPITLAFSLEDQEDDRDRVMLAQLSIEVDDRFSIKLSRETKQAIISLLASDEGPAALQQAIDEATKPKAKKRVRRQAVTQRLKCPLIDGELD